MQVQRIQDYNTNFTGTFKVTKAFEELKSSLTPLQADKFEKCIKNIENVNDGKVFVYKSIPISLNKTKIVTIREVGNKTNQINLPIFVDYDGRNPLKVFEQLANWYKSLV